jgi:hypothetical protein
MSEPPIDLDKHRGMAAQKATDIRRVLAEVEADAKLLRDKQSVVEIQLLAVPATSWPEAVEGVTSLISIRPVSHRPTRITATSWPRCLRTLRGSWGKRPELTDIRA